MHGNSSFWTGKRGCINKMEGDLLFFNFPITFIFSLCGSEVLHCPPHLGYDFQLTDR